MSSESEKPPAEKKSQGRIPKADLPDFPHIRSAEALQELRHRVKKAAKELHRLRRENAALAARIQELEARPTKIDPHTAMLAFEEEPKLLRSTVQSFIKAIDNCLAEEVK